MLTRREVLLVPVAVAAAQAAYAQNAEPGKMLLSIHQNTSRGAGFQGSLEGWARAGIRYVELNDGLLQTFLESNSLAAAGRVLTDNGLTPVCGVSGGADMWIPGPERAASLDRFRLRCEQYKTLGLNRVYTPSGTRRAVTADDFAETPRCIREVGDIAQEFELTAMIEFIRTSTHLSTLTSALATIREAAHPHVNPMLDFFHFWSGLSKFQDLDLLRNGELQHCHFQDLLDTPRELIDNDSRLIPGDGIAPVDNILRKLKERGFTGALSVELFRAEYVDGDPYEVGLEIKQKCEAVMERAGVL